MIKETKELTDLVVKNKEEMGPWFSDPVTQAVVDIGLSKEPGSMTVYAQPDSCAYAFHSDTSFNKENIYAVLTVNAKINGGRNLEIIDNVKTYFQDRLNVSFYNDMD